MKLIIETLKEVRAKLKKQKEQKIDEEERAHIAKAFNDRYTYRFRYNNKAGVIKGHKWMDGGFAWMCPSCNKIHEATEWEPFSGLQYPDCCRYSGGHRGFENIRSE